jgi:probable F420-dependent oxidoreductase
LSSQLCEVIFSLKPSVKNKNAYVPNSLIMKLGLRVPQTGRNVATKENIAYLAKQAEYAGFYSLWVLERLIWPINPKDKYPGTTDGRFPQDWQYIFDPIETLAFVASKTSKILVGTSVIDMLFHNPVILARRFATLDVLSEGRAIAGCGIGWSKDEYEVSNITFEGRSKRADEYVQILKRIWTDDIIEFRGQYYNIPPSRIGPKPLQKPHVPIYLGGYSQKTFARIASNANGWICTIQNSLDQAKSNICKLEEECRKVNRDFEEINIAAILYPCITDSVDKGEGVNQGKTRKLLNGNIYQVGEDLLEISDMGVDQAILNYNRSPISNNIDAMIDLTKKLWKFVG